MKYLDAQQQFLQNGSDLALLNEASKAIEFMQKKQVMTTNKRDHRKALRPYNKRSSDKTQRSSPDARNITSSTPVGDESVGNQGNKKMKSKFVNKINYAHMAQQNRKNSDMEVYFQ